LISISKITLRIISDDVSPHLLRTVGSTSAAMYGGDNPYLASALLGHTAEKLSLEQFNSEQVIARRLGKSAAMSAGAQFYDFRLVPQTEEVHCSKNSVLFDQRGSGGPGRAMRRGG
jgi:hypothetical protein